MERINKNGFNRTPAERYRHNVMMAHDVEQYIIKHFERGGTLEELQNDDDVGSNPGYIGQHQSVHIVRLPIPATRDGLFVIKNLGVGLGGEHPRDAKDLYAEACAMALVSRYTQIPVPWVYVCCQPNETDPQRSFIAMEYIEGEIYGGTLKLTQRQKISIIRQMAIIRIEMIKVISGSIGGVGLPTKRSEADKLNPKFLNSAREMGGLEVWAEGRVCSRSSFLLLLDPTVSMNCANIAANEFECDYRKRFGMQSLMTSGLIPRSEPMFLLFLRKKLRFITYHHKKIHGRSMLRLSEKSLKHGNMRRIRYFT